jgi:hypothetical protein
MKTTIEMAREAAGDDWKLFQEFMPEIHRLAELVRADEREQGQKWFDAVTVQHKAEILAEREACSRARASTPRELRPVGTGALLDEQQYCFNKGWREGAASVRAAIRARSIT